MLPLENIYGPQSLFVFLLLLLLMLLLLMLLLLFLLVFGKLNLNRWRVAVVPVKEEEDAIALGTIVVTGRPFQVDKFRTFNKNGIIRAVHYPLLNCYKHKCKETKKYSSKYMKIWKLYDINWSKPSESVNYCLYFDVNIVQNYDLIRFKLLCPLLYDQDYFYFTVGFRVLGTHN